MTIIFDGRKLAEQKKEELTKKISQFKSEKGYSPKLVSILVGDDESSRLYLSLKKKVAERVGIDFELKQFSLQENHQIIKDFIKLNNDNPQVAGIMMQVSKENKDKIADLIEEIVPAKDVDCLTSTNFGLLTLGKPRFLPATVRGIVSIIKNNNIKIEGVNVTILGASNIVGKPLAIWLSDNGATVTICRSRTQNLKEFTLKADLLISATGNSGLITKDIVKPGAVVIDVASPKGDVDFENVKEIASFITPVPGGVGPMTVVSLLENVFQSALSK